MSRNTKMLSKLHFKGGDGLHFRRIRCDQSSGSGRSGIRNIHSLRMDTSLMNMSTNFLKNEKI